MALDTNIGTHTHELGGEHEAVLEDVLGNYGASVGKGRKHHDLRLHVGRETRERKRLDIDRLDALGAIDVDTVLDTLALDAHKFHLFEHHSQVDGAEARNIDAALIGHEAPATIKVPASMRSPTTQWVTGCSSSTPSMVTTGVPAPTILAPISLSMLARSTISGSRAALSITVVPCARTAA